MIQAKDGTFEVLLNIGRAQKAASQDGAGSAIYRTVSANSEGYGEGPTDCRYATKLVTYRSDMGLSKGRPRGLAISALNFEEPAQQGRFERERALLEQYGAEYTCLIAGGSL